MLARLRSNFLLIFFFLVYLGALGGVIYSTDYQMYRLEKGEHLVNTIGPLGMQIKDRMVRILPGRILEGILPGKNAITQQQAIDAAVEELKGMMDDLVTSSSPIYYAALFDKNNQEIAVASNPEKIWKRRRWDNTIILNFSYGFKTNLTVGQEAYGYFAFKFTNLPRETPDLLVITRAHRIYVFGAIALVTILFGSFFYYVLLPIRNVTAALKWGEEATPGVLRRARTTMESAYNKMACDALLMRLEEAIRSIPEKGENYERFEAQHHLCRALSQLFGYGPAWVVARAAGAGQFALRGAYPTEPGSGFELIESLDGPALARRLDEAELRLAQEPIPVEIRAPGKGVLRALAAPLPPLEPEGMRTVLIARAGRDRGAPSASARSLFARVAEQAGRSLIERQGRRRRLAQERSKANINIARHLGHDLTNIIATSKLDLMAVQNYLKTEQNENAPPDPRRRIFTESLEAVLRNTRFLQEIVNLYRSFGYVRNPQYEWINVNQLAREMGELFSYSTSAKVRVETRLDPSAPFAALEPRLIRFSLFNLLTNAVEAINAKNKAPGVESRPESGVAGAFAEARAEVRANAHDANSVTLSTALVDGGARVQISVRDTGTGIRGRDGQLLPADHLRDILYLGITTKDEEGAEGLGLDWVRTIVEEFHQGRIVPRNVQGGAEFILDIPVQSPERPVVEKTNGQI